MPASKPSRGLGSVCAAPSAFRVTLVSRRTNYTVLFLARLSSCLCTLFHRMFPSTTPLKAVLTQPPSPIITRVFSL
jgi:hypothetical protein